MQLRPARPTGVPPSGPGWVVRPLGTGWRADYDQRYHNGWHHVYKLLYDDALSQADHISRGDRVRLFWSYTSEYSPPDGYPEIEDPLSNYGLYHFDSKGHAGDVELDQQRHRARQRRYVKCNHFVVLL